MSESIKSANPDLVVQLGDVSENGGMDFLWRYTLKNISRYASQAPFMSAVGNHSYYWNGNYNFRKIFPYNYVSDKGLYYSMDYYNSHMIFLDLFDDEMKISEEQKDWAEADLSEAVKQGKKWIFIFLHDNVLGTGDGPPNWELQKWLVPLADKYNVDAVFFGHVHNYEHWLYTYGNSGLLYEKNQTPTGRPVHYFCSGGGGAALGYYYNLMEHEPRNISRTWYDTNLDEYRVINITDTKWDSEQYIDHMDNPRYGAPPDGKHYYQIPGNNSFSSSNELYGYQYGEQTLHYINIEVSGEKNSICEISVHYPNGDLLKGPNDNLPQSWVLTK